MAIRNIRLQGDAVLTKPCREVTEITPKMLQLIQDMFDTMYHAGGVGLAAPQVGILKRIVTIDVGDEEQKPLTLINPVLLEKDGEQTGQEGCLSLPGKAGIVTRPNYVKVKAKNEQMEDIIVEGSELLARALCHEIDHLDGHMYMELVEGDLFQTKTEEE